MQVKVEIGGVRLDKAVADLTSLSRSHANEQIKNGHLSQRASQESQVCCQGR